MPNFGVDKDILATQGHIKLTENKFEHELDPEALKPEVPPKMDYKLPDLGVDHDIKTTQNHLKDAEKDIGPWNLIQTESSAENDPICGSGGCESLHKKAALGYPINYPVPNFGTDQDNKDTKRSIEIGEESHSHKLVMNTPESKAKWHNPAKDTDYNFAPDLDADMRHTSQHLSDA